MNRQQELIMALTGYLREITDNEFFPYKGTEYNLSVIQAENEQGILDAKNLKELVLEAYDEACELYPAYGMKEPNLEKAQLQDLLTLYNAYYNMLP